jgi:hypothetical protein
VHVSRGVVMSQSCLLAHLPLLQMLSFLCGSRKDIMCMREAAGRYASCHALVLVLLVRPLPVTRYCYWCRVSLVRCRWGLGILAGP